MGPKPNPAPLSRGSTYRPPADPDLYAGPTPGQKKRELVGAGATFEEGERALTPRESRDQASRPEEACEDEQEPWSGEMRGPDPDVQPLSQNEAIRFAVLVSDVRANILDAFQSRMSAVGVLTDILQDDKVSESTLLEDVVSAALGAVSGGLLGVIAAKLLKPIASAVGQAVHQMVLSAVASPSQPLIAEAVAHADAMPTPGAFQDSLYHALEARKNQWRDEWDAAESRLLAFPDRGALAEVELLAASSKAVAVRAPGLQLASALGEWANLKHSDDDDDGVLEIYVRSENGALTVTGSEFTGISQTAVTALVRRGLTLRDLMPSSGGTLVRIVESRGGALESQRGRRNDPIQQQGTFAETQRWLIALAQQRYAMLPANAWNCRHRIVEELARMSLASLRIKGD